MLAQTATQVMSCQVPSLLGLCPAAAWSLLRPGQWARTMQCACHAGELWSSGTNQCGGGQQGHHQLCSPPLTAAGADSQGVAAGGADRMPLLSALARTPAVFTAAHLHHAAALPDHGAASSDDDSQAVAAAGPSSAQQQQQHSFSAHAQRAVTSLAWLGPSASQQPGHPPPAHHPQQHGRYQGHLHAPHGRRHATTSHQSSVDRFISEQLLSCKSLGMLRRIMIKHKATMEPEHVADTLLCLQHLVLAARAARRGAGAGGGPLAATGAGGVLHHHATSQARAQPRVRASGEFGSRAKPRSAERDGHMEQLVAQMLGELGSMIWFQMGDMMGPDLAKILYSWATLEWHPEPELLADVKASFVAAAVGGGVQPHSQQQVGAAASAGGSGPSSGRPQQQGGPEGGAAQGQAPWLAAGLWGLAKLQEPFEGQLLQVLQQHWRALLPLWTPQQMADVAGALVAAADEQVAAAAASATPEGERQASDMLQQQLAPVVLGLAQQLVVGVLQEQGSDEEAGEPYVPLPWPESMLVRLQGALHPRPAPTATKHDGKPHAAAPSVVVDSSSSSASSSASSSVGAGAPLMAVHNVPHLAWRMLQALAAVGVNVSEPEDPAQGGVIAALSAATKARARRS